MNNRVKSFDVDYMKNGLIRVWVYREMGVNYYDISVDRANWLSFKFYSFHLDGWIYKITKFHNDCVTIGMYRNKV